MDIFRIALAVVNGLFCLLFILSLYADGDKIDTSVKRVMQVITIVLLSNMLMLVCYR